MCQNRRAVQEHNSTQVLVQLFVCYKHMPRAILVQVHGITRTLLCWSLDHDEPSIQTTRSVLRVSYEPTAVFLHYKVCSSIQSNAATRHFRKG